MKPKNNKSDFQKGHGSRKNNERNRGSRAKARQDFTSEDKYDKEANKGKGRASNSPEWYGASSILMQAAAKLPFSNTAGLPISIGNEHCPVPTVYNPGIIALDVVTTPGIANDWSDPVNVAIRDMYTAMRSANAGGKAYNVADLGMYFMAYDACATYYAWMVRLYGTLRTVILRNIYSPEALVQACGGKYADLVANMAQLHSYILTYASKLFRFKVPSTFHLLERHMWLFSHIYADAPLDKAQFYVFRPKGFWKYRTGTTSEDTGLFLTEVGTWGFNEIVAFGEDLINSILNSEDFVTMSADIVRAFGTSVFTVNPISDDYSVMPVYDPEVLMQIHNATVTTLRTTADPASQVDIYGTWRIVEDYIEGENVGAIRVCLPISPNWLNAYSAANKILDVAVEDPDPTVICLATRLMFDAKFGDIDEFWPSTTNDHSWNGHNGKCFWPTSFGTEIVCDMKVISVVRGDNGARIFNEVDYNTEELELFNQHPLLVYITRDSSAVIDKEFEGGPIHSIQGDFNNYTVLDANALFNLHRAALMGMYGMAK